VMMFRRLPARRRRQEPPVHGTPAGAAIHALCRLISPR
jgi:hypothetical protein